MNKHGKTRATQRNSALLKTQKSGLKATQTRTSMVKHMQLSATKSGYEQIRGNTKRRDGRREEKARQDKRRS